MAGLLRAIESSWGPAARGALLPRIIDSDAVAGASCGVLFTQKRFRVRAHTRAKQEAIARANKRKKDALLAAKPPAPPKVVKDAPIDQDIKYKGRVPLDDVWMQKYYPRQRFTLLEAVNMHREFAAPEVTDNLDGMVFLSCTLDTRAKKKNKFIKEFSQTVVLPHHFNDGTTHRIMVFAKEAEDKEMASHLGAEICGGADLVKAFTKGDIKHDDYDHCICMADMYDDISTLRKYLRERFPTPEGHSVSGDLTAMFRYFTEGKTYKMRPLPTPGEGQVELPICTLRMTDEQVLENFETFMVMLHSVKKEHPFQFVTKCVVRSPPSKEEFMLLDSELAPREEEEEEEEADDDQQESVAADKQ